MGLVLLGTLLLVGGVLASLTGVGLVVGVPAAVLGVVLIVVGSALGTLKLLSLPVRLLLRVLLAPLRAAAWLIRWVVAGV
jgi:hypothetical protein